MHAMQSESCSKQSQFFNATNHKNYVLTKLPSENKWNVQLKLWTLKLNQGNSSI